MKTAVLLLGHGSKAKEANDAMYATATLVKRLSGTDIVELGFMDLNPPTIPDGVAACVSQGAKRIVFIPYFLHLGVHVQQDLPALVDGLRRDYPGVEMIMGKHLGFHPKLAEIVMERIDEAIGR